MSDVICPKCQATGDQVAGVELWGIYDGILYWQCLPHGHRWHRFPPNHHLRIMAEQYMRNEEQRSPATMVRDADRAQRWHVTNHADSISADWSSCAACDPDVNTSRPNPFWTRATGYNMPFEDQC